MSAGVGVNTVRQLAHRTAGLWLEAQHERALGEHGGESQRGCLDLVDGAVGVAERVELGVGDDVHFGLQRRAQHIGHALVFDQLVDVGAHGAQRAPARQQLGFAGHLRQRVPGVEQRAVFGVAAGAGAESSPMLDVTVEIASSAMPLPA